MTYIVRTCVIYVRIGTKEAIKIKYNLIFVSVFHKLASIEGNVVEKWLEAI